MGLGMGESLGMQPLETQFKEAKGIGYSRKGKNKAKALLLFNSSPRFLSPTVEARTSSLTSANQTLS